MLEFLLTIGASELGKAIFEQALKLGQSAAEDYVKDFFKDCLKEGITSTKPEVTKKAVAQALKEFLVLVQKELEDWEISEAEIRDLYDRPLVQFVKNDLVKPILGRAFERDCTAIDTIALTEIWKNSNFRDKPFPEMPPEFNWQVIGGKYIKKVQKIIRETPELRALLEIELLEKLNRQGNISPGFDVTKYRDILQSSYGVLKLHTIDNTDQQYRMKLWNMFIEPSVREALPPSRHELPTDLKRQLHEQGRIESDLSLKELDLYRDEYFQQPLQKALTAIFGSNHAVILGDPGSGKSTLLQYLALEWVEGKIKSLPLLLELREYAIAPAANFLEFLHSGRGVDWQFDQHQLHEHLQNYPTLIMFDGLDEVFDRSSQSTVIDDIIRFAQQYPKSQIVVTSRIIGYNPEHLQNSGFRHFTIQPLETNEINKFIDRWYTLALGEDADKIRLAERLKEAIANSKAIANLADNPLLLTMMAILNRRQELPRDRAELYDQASRVLLHNWDVDHKRLQVPMDAIGRREKQEMLRLVAYEMQSGTEGLKGNAIDAGRLTRVLKDYLFEQGFSEPREKASVLIQQLRERNFILCYRGADIYGFVHRTFLEYFCAFEIVQQFEKTRSLSFEQLRDDVFGQHWQDDTWNEVLRLICGMIDPKFAGMLIEFLIEQQCDRDQFLRHNTYFNDTELDVGGLANLLLAADCLFDAGNSMATATASKKLLQKIQTEVEYSEARLRFTAAFELLNRTIQNFPEVLDWLKKQVVDHKDSSVRSAAVNAIAKYNKSPETLEWLKKSLAGEANWAVRRSSAWAIPQNYECDAETLQLLHKCILEDEERAVRCAAILSTSRYYPTNSVTFDLFCNTVQNDPFIREYTGQDNPRQLALESLLSQYSDHPRCLELLRERSINDPDELMRIWAKEQLEQRKRTE
jgi:hypothetical protein